MDPTATLVQQALLYVLMPLWLLAGFADYLCHRVLHIEYSAGVKEAVLHLLLLAELGAAFLLILLFEVNAAVLALLIGIAVLHELTAWWDLAYAASRRRIPVPEQWVHGLQEFIPWAGLAGLMVLHPEQTWALFGLGDEVPDWSMNLRPPPLPPRILALLALGGLLLVLLPFIAEYRRCRNNRGTFSPRGS
jgi:hypothetical protein